MRPASVDTPGLSHRHNNDFFLKTSPVNSLFTAGSGHCPSKLHLGTSSPFLHQQLSPSTQPGRRIGPGEASQVAERTVWFTLACQGGPALCRPRAACSPAGIRTSCLMAGDTGEAQRFPAQARRHPQPQLLLECELWRRKRQAWWLVILEQGCVCMNSENKPEVRRTCS